MIELFRALSDKPVYLALAVVSIVGWIVVLVTGMTELFADEPRWVLTTERISMLIAFASTIVFAVLVFLDDRKRSRD